MSQIVPVLLRFDGVAHARTLAAYDINDKQRARAVNSGAVERLRRGWFALAGLDSQAVRAIRAGGHLSCVSLLGLHGVWLPLDERMHIISVAPRSRLRSPENRAHPLMGSAPPVVALQRIRHAYTIDPTVSLACACACAAACLTITDAIIMLDSVRNLRVLPDAHIEEALASLSQTRQTALAHSRAGAESGTETLVRLRLTGLHLRVRPQVQIQGVGRVDLVVGDRLVIEVDSRAHHDNPAAYEHDRTRDLALVERGYLVIRVTYRRVMSDMGSIERAVLAVVRRRDHLWPRGHRTPDAAAPASTRPTR